MCRAFELRPEPAPTLEPDGSYLRRVWDESVYPMARERGMTLRLPPVQPRSRKAFEVAGVARAAGLFGPMHRALFAAFFEDGRDIGSPDVLLDVGRSVGLDLGTLGAALAGGRHGAKVEADRRAAEGAAVGGVPALLARAGRGRAVRVDGARPYEVVTAAVRAAAGGAAPGAA